jgi:hypothetical protein
VELYPLPVEPMPICSTKIFSPIVNGYVDVENPTVPLSRVKVTVLVEV